VTNAVLYRLRDAGWSDVFRLARAPVAEIAYRANVSPADARAAREAARLTTLRGIGTRHAAALIGGGIASVEVLSTVAPDSVWRIVGGARRGSRRSNPTPAEVRVWVRAARSAREPAAAPAPAGVMR
jgi:Domain of unknown function (DUF4332)